MTDIEEYLEGWDGGAMAGRSLRTRRELAPDDVVIAQWGEASGSVQIVRADGSMSATGRQVAAYRPRPWEARAGERTNGGASLWHEDGDRCVDVEDQRSVLVYPESDEDEAYS